MQQAKRILSFTAILTGMVLALASLPNLQSQAAEAAGPAKQALVASAATASPTRGETRVSAAIAGKIKFVRATEGAQVRKGQIVAILEFDKSMARCVAAEAALKRAANPREETAARAEIAQARAEWEKHFIRAPFSGTVVRQNLSAGDEVHDSAAVVTIASK